MHRPVYFIASVILYRKHTGVRDIDFTARGSIEGRVAQLVLMNTGVPPAGRSSRGPHRHSAMSLAVTP